MPGYGYRGRYGANKLDEEERSGFVKIISSRAWYLIIPLIGLVYANARQVTPQVQQLKKTLTTEQKALDLQRTQTLTQANPLRAHISALKALGDTFQVRFTQMDVLADSVSTLLAEDRRSEAKLQAELDSLNLVHSQAARQLAACNETLKGVGPIIDSLKAVIGVRHAETESLRAVTAQNLDLADRVLNPDKYRKNTALVTGQGDFPNRDALPKR